MNKIYQDSHDLNIQLSLATSLNNYETLFSNQRRQQEAHQNLLLSQTNSELQINSKLPPRVISFSQFSKTLKSK